MTARIAGKNMELVPNGEQQFSYANGNPLVNGSVGFYIPNTLTPKATYTTQAGNVPNPNPVLLDGNGRAVIWGSGTYRQIVKDSNSNTIWDEIVSCDAADILQSTLSTSSGASFIGGGTQVVSSIAALRGLSKLSASLNALVTGYHTPGDGGGGNYWYNAADVSSADNGGTIIVANDGGRWYLSYVNQISVKQFGATGNGSTDDTTAFQNCVAAFQQNVNFRGTTIFAPSGYYILSGTIAFTAYAAGTVHNIYLVGDGPDNTVLDWSSAPPLTNGITFNTGSHFGVSDIALVNAPSINLLINNGAFGTSNYCNFFHIRNVRMQGAGGDNFKMFNTYMGTIEDCWSFGAAGNGYTYAGAHTTIKTNRCESNANRGAGWSLNGMVYSEFAACGSDSNGGRGWTMTNMNGVTFNSIGAEQNGADAITMVTGSSFDTGIPAEYKDIHGVVFNGCFTTGNSASSAGTYGSFITASTQNSRPIEFVINGGESWPNTSSDIALILAGTSGTINVVKTLFNDNNFTAADSINGTVHVNNLTVTGRSCLATLAAATESIPNNLLTTLPLSTSPSSNDMAATISSNAITIPRGVNKVRVSANVDFATNSTGVRQLFIQKNGLNTIGLASVDLSAALSGDTILTASSPVIATVPGDTYSCQVYQNSGGSLNVVQGSTTYFCVEAVC